MERGRFFKKTSLKIPLFEREEEVEFSSHELLVHVVFPFFIIIFDIDWPELADTEKKKILIIKIDIFLFLLCI